MTNQHTAGPAPTNHGGEDLAKESLSKASLLRLDMEDHQAAEVYVRGYGVKSTTPGYGAPIYIEPDPTTGELFLYVWADINKEDYTHKISLACAQELKRREESE